MAHSPPAPTPSSLSPPRGFVMKVDSPFFSSLLFSSPSLPPASFFSFLFFSSKVGAVIQVVRVVADSLWHGEILNGLKRPGEIMVPIHGPFPLSPPPPPHPSLPCLPFDHRCCNYNLPVTSVQRVIIGDIFYTRRP